MGIISFILFKYFMEAQVPFTLILHIQNSQPVVGEVEEIPSPTDTLIILKNPRQMDGKDMTGLMENVVTVIFPIERVNFVEVMTSTEEEEIIGFVRE
jgi:hypothetical protein